jgi:hypothetical protein
VARALDERGTIPSDAEVVGLELGPDSTATGVLTGGGSLLLAEAEDPGWSVTVDGEAVAPPVGTPSRVDGLQAGEITIVHDGRSARLVAVTWQVLLLLGVVSLALRPPGFARRRPTGSEVAT